jgi:ubiquinone/menaquinone biosynthesis C-methylase UbiE
MGTGDASIAKILMERSYNLTTVDVRDKTMYEEIAPTIYNGDQLPYEDDSFDTVLILFVLHHANNPKQILQEAKRVSRDRIIIKEDIYKNNLDFTITKLSDSLANLEFFGHPHNNLKDEEWKSTFKSLGLKLVHHSYKREFYLFLPFLHATYVVEV